MLKLLKPVCAEQALVLNLNCFPISTKVCNNVFFSYRCSTSICIIYKKIMQTSRTISTLFVTVRVGKHQKDKIDAKRNKRTGQ